MSPHLSGPFDSEEFQKNLRLMTNIADRYHSDAMFRARVAGDARDALMEMGLRMPEGLDVTVVANTNDVAYFVMPPDPNVELSDETLQTVAGGDRGINCQHRWVDFVTVVHIHNVQLDRVGRHRRDRRRDRCVELNRVVAAVAAGAMMLNRF